MRLFCEERTATNPLPEFAAGAAAGVGACFGAGGLATTTGGGWAAATTTFLGAIGGGACSACGCTCCAAICGGGTPIVTLGGDAVLLGGNRKAHNTTAKNGLVGLTRALAKELAGDGIRVNCVSPGMVQTEVVTGFANQVSPEVVAADEARYPLGYGTPEDVANTVSFFLAPASKWITGTNLIMDGGLT